MATHAEFCARKRQILTSLDKSPKGSIDAPIVDFIHWLNQQPALVTTSSCSGRIAIFHGSADASNSKGGEWLLASHETVSDSTRSWQELSEALDTRRNAANGAVTLTSLLLEPFVLHAECADAATAQQILGIARDAGFRESGVSLGRKRVMVQIRTVATRLEVPLAMNGTLLVDGNYFETLIAIANSRLDENAARVARLWRNLREALVANDQGIEGVEHGQPWIFVCPQECARSVKLALEARGWLDDSRKMQSYGDPDAEATPSVAIPLTEEAVEELQAISEAEAEEVDVSRGGTTASDDLPPAPAEVAEALPEPDSRPAGSVPKKKRPPTVAANLNELWRSRRGELRIIQSSILARKIKPSGSASVAPAATEQAKIAEAVQRLFEICPGLHGDTASFEALFKDAQSLPALQWRGDVALLPRGSFAGAEWEAFEQKTQAASGGLWECIRNAVNARLLCRQQEIRVDDVVRGGNVQVLAGAGSGWVLVPGPKGVRYSFDITKCMFSEGNAAEKDRVASWPVKGQTILDMYAGIGFWTLPLLVAGAAKVVACEWNPDALAGLREGLHLLDDQVSARCIVLPGDNRRQEVIDETRDTCHRVILGLIPYSRDGFPVAVTALRPTGGTLHVHWNAAVDAEAATAELVAKEVQELLQRIRGPGWQAAVTGIQRIKSFAPRVRHLRIDVECKP